MYNDILYDIPAFVRQCRQFVDMVIEVFHFAGSQEESFRTALDINSTERLSRLQRNVIDLNEIYYPFAPLDLSGAILKFECHINNFRVEHTDWSCIEVERAVQF